LKKKDLFRGKLPVVAFAAILSGNRCADPNAGTNGEGYGQTQNCSRNHFSHRNKPILGRIDNW
jgi:hypothetical protein